MTQLYKYRHNLGHQLVLFMIRSSVNNNTNIVFLNTTYRIIFKICTINYQALSPKQPAYLHSLLTPARQPRQLRPSNSNLLFVTSVKTNIGTRAFSAAVPTLWNILLVSVKSVGYITFRCKLKTHLFKLAYPP